MPPDTKCRCASGRLERRCCGPFLAGRPPPTPELLMRARYSAYALGDAAFIITTTEPDGPQWEPDEAAWRASITTFTRSFRFRGVTILDAPLAGGDVGFVTFTAHLEAGGVDRSFTERSRFVLRDRWRYHSGERA